MRDACAAGDVDRATTAALRRYGPELLGFLVGMHHDHDMASDAFAVFSEKLWQSMARFEWKCSLSSELVYAMLRHDWFARTPPSMYGVGERPLGRRGGLAAVAPHVPWRWHDAVRTETLSAQLRTRRQPRVSEALGKRLTTIERWIPEEDPARC